MIPRVTYLMVITSSCYYINSHLVYSKCNEILHIYNIAWSFLFNWISFINTCSLFHTYNIFHHWLTWASKRPRPTFPPSERRPRTFNVLSKCKRNLYMDDIGIEIYRPCVPTVTTMLHLYEEFPYLKNGTLPLQTTLRLCKVASSVRTEFCFGTNCLCTGLIDCQSYSSYEYSCLDWWD